MKNFYSTLILLLITNFNTIAQIKSNYAQGFEIGFKEGYCYNRTTYDCFTPMTPLAPMPRINENKDNYTEGYNRGFQYGLDLRRSNDALRNSDVALNQKVVSFNQYVPQNPTEAMRIVGMIRQQKYDARTEWLQQKVYQLTSLNETLFNEQNFPEGFPTYIHKNKLRSVMVDYFDEIKAYDFGDDSVFQNVQLNLNNIEKYYYDYYNSIVSQITQRAEKEQQKSNNYVPEKPAQKSKPNPSDLLIEGLPENRSVDGKMSSSFLGKNNGSYNCSINVYKLTKKEPVLKEILKGNIIINGNVIQFKDDKKTTWKARELLSEITDRQSKKYFYITKEGNVYIDFEFKTITFFEINGKNYYEYIIESKM